MRIAGIDYGTVRIGIATADTEVGIAGPLRELHPPHARARRRVLPAAGHRRAHRPLRRRPARALERPREPEVGRGPRHSASGSDGMTGVPVEYFDERYTTAEADELLGGAKLTKKQRQARRDQLAAQIMLTAYLEAGARGQDDPGRRSNDAKLIFGCGYLGRARCASLWRKQLGTRCRSSSHAALTTRAADLQRHRRTLPSAIVADVTQPADARPNLPAAETVLYSPSASIAPPAARSKTSMPAACKTSSPPCPPASAASSTSAPPASTATAGGEWVDEDTPPDPQRDGGRASLAAEQVLAASSVRRSRHRPATRGHLRPGARAVPRQTPCRRTDTGGE